MLFPFGQEPLESEKSSCSSLGLVSFVIYKCLLSVLCWSWDRESAWKTDPSWASENQAMPAKQPKGSSAGPGSALDTGGQP